jgi:hypothetical protein
MGGSLAETTAAAMNVLIVRAAMGSISRFEDFHAHLGSRGRRSRRARVGRRPRGHGESAVPVRYDYRLAPKGDALTPALVALTEWGQWASAS